MNILLINDFLKISGGAEVSFTKTANLLRKKDHKVFLLGKKDNKESFSTFFSRWFSLRYFFKTINAIKKNKIELVHINGFTRAISPSPAVAAKLMGIPVVLTIRDFFLYCPKTWAIFSDGKKCSKSYNLFCPFYNCESAKRGIKYLPYNTIKFLKGTLHRILLKNSVDLFICISKELKSSIAKSFRLPDDKVVFIPNFIEMNSQLPEDKKEKREGLLFVGRISREKGLEVVIQAVANLIKEGTKNVKLKVIGDGPEKEKMENLAKELKIAKNIIFLGRIDEEEKLNAIYRSSQAVIFPSMCQEGFGRVIIEAMRQKTPVISSNVGGASGFIKHKKNGLIFERGNASDLAKNIKYILKDEEAARKMGEEGFKTAKLLFNEEAHYKKLINCYKEALALK